MYGTSNTILTPHAGAIPSRMTPLASAAADIPSPKRRLKQHLASLLLRIGLHALDKGESLTAFEGES